MIDAIKALLCLKGILLGFLAHMRGRFEHQALRQADVLFNSSLVHVGGSVCRACL